MKRTFIGISVLAQFLIGTVVSAACSPDKNTWLPIEWGVLGDSVIWVGEIATYSGNLIAAINYTNSSCIASWDGNTWAVLGTTNRKVASLEVYDGKLYVGGDFSRIAGIATIGIGVWDGTSWSAVGGGANGTVACLGRYDGKLFAGGPFNMVGGIWAPHIAQWNGTAWSPLGSGLNELAHTMVEYDGKLIVGGFFTSAGGAPANRVAAWDGAAWSPLESGIGDGSVLTCIAYKGKVYVHGLFTIAGGEEIKYLAAWDGSSWSSLGSGIVAGTPSVASFCEFNGDLIVAGNFDSAGGAPANCMAAWDGASWRPFDSETYWGSQGIAGWRLGLFNNELYAVGYLLDAVGVPTYRIARWTKPTFEAGDANVDGTANVGDAVFLISYVFKGGAAPDPIEAGDANCDGGTNVGDAVYLISYIFKGGAAPCCPSAPGTVTDIDGNVYQTVTIGTQVWMAENLKVTHYRNGDAIPNVTDETTWQSLTTGAYCEYDNDVNSVATYGRLYNWHAVADMRNIAPAGWHVASDAEWKQLEMYLGMSQTESDQTGWRGTDEGGKLKEIGTVHWISPNTGATNESGFTALPGGYRSLGGVYYDVGAHAVFWSSTENSSGFAWCRNVGNTYSGVHRFDGGEEDGFSVRCVKD